MTDEREPNERCGTCRRELNGDASFARIYQDGRRIVLCSPACAEHFIFAPTLPAPDGGPRDYLEELIEELRWTQRSGADRPEPAPAAQSADLEIPPESCKAASPALSFARRRGQEMHSGSQRVRSVGALQ
jgi:hypothetical protein